MSKSKNRTPNRPKRAGLRRKGPLKTKQLPGFVLRWVNQKESNVEELEDVGYTAVTQDEMYEGDLSLADGSIESGSTIQKSVGQGIKAILMKIPEDLYNEIQEEKAREIDERVRGSEPDPEFGFIKHDVET